MTTLDSLLADLRAERDDAVEAARRMRGERDDVIGLLVKKSRVFDGWNAALPWRKEGYSGGEVREEGWRVWYYFADREDAVNAVMAAARQKDLEDAK